MRIRLLGAFAPWERTLAADTWRGLRLPLNPSRAAFLASAYHDPTSIADLVRIGSFLALIIATGHQRTPILLASPLATSREYLAA